MRGVRPHPSEEITMPAGKEYMRAHYAARNAIDKTCEHCGANERLHAALRPDVPAEHIKIDPISKCSFSLYPLDYFALCIPCHRKLDWVELRTHCRHGHEYTPENTHVKSDGSRRCRTCHREQARLHNSQPEKRQIKNERDSTYRTAHPMTPEQKARKLELQRQRRAVGKATSR